MVRDLIWGDLRLTRHVSDNGVITYRVRNKDNISLEFRRRRDAVAHIVRAIQNKESKNENRS